jgi:prophage regulatory protein
MTVCKAGVRRPLMKGHSPLDDAASNSARSDRPIGRTGLIRILRLAEVIETTGLGKTKIYGLQATGQFPMRVQITSHCVGWVEEEIQRWLAHRVANRTSAPSPVAQYAASNRDVDRPPTGGAASNCNTWQ